MYYTVIKDNGHLRTGRKCRKHELHASILELHFLSVLKCLQGVFYHTVQHMAQASSIALWYRFYLHKTIKHAFSMFYTVIKHVFFDQSEHTQGPNC